MEPANLLWLLVTGGGPLLLVILIAWALMRKRKLSRREQVARDQGTREVFDERR